MTTRTTFWTGVAVLLQACADGQKLTPGPEAPPIMIGSTIAEDARASVLEAEEEVRGDAGAPLSPTSDAGALDPELEQPIANEADAAPDADPEVAVDSGPVVALPDSVDSCPGRALALPLSPVSTSTSSSTLALTDDATSTGCAMGAGGHDAVYRFTPTVSGSVTVTLTPSGYTGALHVRAGDCEGGFEVACGTAPVLNLPVGVTFDATAGTTYYVFADQQYGLTQGSFVLNLEREGGS